MHPSEMQAVRIRFSVEYETVVLIPRPDGTDEDLDARRDAANDAVANIDIPEAKDVEYVSDTFKVIECTDDRTGKVTGRELRLVN